MLLPLRRLAPPSCLTPPVMLNPPHGVRSESALVVLPGPVVGRPRGHRVRGAGTYGGVHDRELAGAVSARGSVPLRRGSAQTAGATAPRRGHRSRRPGAAWPAVALTFTNIHRKASRGESVNSGTKRGTPAGPTPCSTIHEGEYPYIAQTIVAADPTEGLPRGRFWPHRTGGYAGCWMRTSGNAPSTHSGE